MNSKIVVLGSINMDLVVNAPRHPKIGETIKGSNFQMISGGKGANQAVALARQNTSPTFIGCVGNDSFGAQLLKLLDDEGVNTRHILSLDNVPTGIASIVVDEQSRNSIVVSPGANEKIDQAQLDRATEDIKNAELLICQLETNFDAVLQAIDIAYQHNTRIILNPAPVRNLPPDLLTKIDYLIPNEIEASMLTNCSVLDKESATRAARQLLEKGIGNVLLTLGKEGALLATPELVLHVPAYKVKPVDTTAAGDTFVGSFAVGLLKGLPHEANIKRSQAAAAISVTRSGAQPSIPTENEIDLFIKQNN